MVGVVDENHEDDNHEDDERLAAYLLKEGKRIYSSGLGPMTRSSTAVHNTSMYS
jgi:hypothetical protein